MMDAIFHCPCPMVPKDMPAPEMKWGGFSMAGAADYVCELCGMTVMIFEESEQEVIKRLRDENKI